MLLALSLMHVIFLVAKKLSYQGPVISLDSRKLGRRSSTNEKEQLSCIQNAYWLANSYNFTLKIHALLSHGEKTEQGVRSTYVLFIRKKKGVGLFWHLNLILLGYFMCERLCAIVGTLVPVTTCMLLKKVNIICK